MYQEAEFLKDSSRTRRSAGSGQYDRQADRDRERDRVLMRKRYDSGPG